MDDPKHKGGPKARLPEDAKPEPTAAPQVFQPIETVKKDGYTVVLKFENGTSCEAKWHKTRRFVPSPTGGTWQETGWWKIPITGEKLTHEPVGWRPVA